MTLSSEHSEFKLCPRCKGIGLIETTIGGKYCYDCKGTGRLPDKGPTNRTGEWQERAHGREDGPASTECQAAQVSS